MRIHAPLACLAPLAACLWLTACDADPAPAGPATTADAGATAPAEAHRARVARLLARLPEAATGLVSVDLASLRAGPSAPQIAALLADTAGDPALRPPFAALGRLTAGLADPTAVASALLVFTAAPGEALLLAHVGAAPLDRLAPDAEPLPDAGPAPVARDGAGRHLALLPEGVLVIGAPPAVQAVIARAAPDAAPIAPFLPALDLDADVSFAYGLPALLTPPAAPDGTLRSAQALTGHLVFDGPDLSGAVAIHTAHAGAFVARYNALNAAATAGDAPLDRPLTLADALVGDLGQVALAFGPTPIDPDPQTLQASRNTLKKLVVGMQADAYAEGVGDPGNPAWVDLIVKSAADGDTPPSPGSVFIRWDFKDQAAIEAFERDVLPAGFRLAPCRFFESDAPGGEVFVALNLYNAGGGSIVNGARAEWDVFVHPPAGADPDAGTRPRFMVFDALAQAVSADPVHLLTPAEPLSHAFVGDDVVTRVARLEDGEQLPVFASAFPTPDPAVAPVARFTREMAIGNDYIYWGHGVHDRVLYNATTFNYDAYFVDPAQVEITDDSRWAAYLAPEIKDVVYYVNALEYVASPMANLRGEHLDITPEWRAELLGFKTNGHQIAMMRKAVEQLFRGTGDALVTERLDNATPTTTYHFEITDPAGLAAALGLAADRPLRPTPLFEGGAATHALTLTFTTVADAPEGARAEWSVVVAGDGGRPQTWVIDRHTRHGAVDPAQIIGLPADVAHRRTGDRIETRLVTPGVIFEASLSADGADDAALALDWIEAGDTVCRPGGICDQRFYDAETLDVPVHRVDSAQIDQLQTPWDAFIDPTPRAVFFRDNAQPFALKAWQSLKVPVPDPPFAGLPDATHTLSGSGALAGRDTDVVNSEYRYAGDAIVADGELIFAMDQGITNLLGEAHIYTTGSFDLATGVGTQTVVDCQGPALLCGDVVDGSSAYYAAAAIDAADPDQITWQVQLVVNLGGSFGLADSASTLTATRTP